MTNRDRLALLGEALFGERWGRAVARSLGVDPRQVQRWTSGEYAVPDGVIADLIHIARSRQVDLADAIKTAGRPPLESPATHARAKRP